MKEALVARRDDSSFSRSLNGMWKFNWVTEPSLRPVDFYKTEFDTSGWKEIPVPSCWQMEGYGTPYYRNNGYTFQKNWPHVLTTPPTNYTAYIERDPVGSYRREFEVPKDWDGRRIFLTFDGVDSAFFLWINGEKVGFSINSRNAAEFDITKYLKPGKNLLAAEVYTYSAGTYIEDQDMWRMSGIFRNVTLWSAPEVHIRDFFVKTDLDAKYADATLSASAKVRNFSDQRAAAHELQVEIFDAKNHSIAKTVASVPALAAGEEKSVEVSIPVSNPAKWTAETPYLYTTVLSLSGEKNGEIISAKTGFRKIEIKDRIFMVNGVPIKLKGVNRHENWPDTGHYVPEEKMIRDLELLKQGNVNHVRTCHYSDDPRWYELCDEYGIYLVAEANCECHGYMHVLDHEPKYEKAIEDRSVANVENFKNHPSIVIWSLGNECGGGSNFVFALKAVKALDTSRPVHYEPFGIGEKNPADIDSHMYTGVAETEKIATDSKYTKPFYLCEYAHAMFNSMGSLGDYNDVFDKYPTLMGGAIWEWEDQGIWNRRDTNRQFLAFGGGFGDYPNDHYFIHKGVVFSDRSPKPHYPEMKRVYQWISITADDLATGKIKIRNRYAFINLERFNGGWTLSEDGAVIDKGSLRTLNLAPGAEKSVAIGMRKFTPQPGARYDLRISFTLRQEELWAKAGYEVAAEQFKLPDQSCAMTANPATLPAVHLQEGDSVITVTGTSFSVTFDKTTGTISQLMRDGENLLISGGGPRLNLWRAPHQKDDMWAYKSWHNSGLDDLQWTVKLISATPVSDSAVRVETIVKGIGKNQFSIIHSANYTVYGDGSIVVDNAVLPQGGKIALARMGVRLQLDKAFHDFTYLGRGPMENYSDRKRGSDVGLYSSTVKEQMTPYAKPMECGNHEDVYWAALSGENLPTLMVQADESNLQVSALPYTDEAMMPVEYSIDLPPSTSTVVNVATHTLGVGSNGCGPRPLEPYMVWSTPEKFSYVLRLLPLGKNDLSVTGRLAAPRDHMKPVMPAPESAKAIQGTVIAASSFERGEGDPNHAVDGDPNTYWHSRWSSNEAQPPHFLVIDYSHPMNLSGLIYTARTDGDNGHIKDYEVYLSDDAQTWNAPVAKGSFNPDASIETIRFAKPVTARYLKFVALNEQNDHAYAAVGELEPIEIKSLNHPSSKD
ncbi:MAG TPA: glycoside hydrolase family 2 TIM barrel-domain containing protein [Verrucomicrobiae bacterium]|nr:glycoside hydrolase family 2 TIM barrel-domain containing protein [Verrucomicrobiae bacterium]